MLTRALMGATAGALVGAAMLAISATSASAFTMSSPSLEQPIASSHVDHVWWDRWGRWHPNRAYWAGRRCWRGYYGHLHCAW